tara:strand:+ start:28 stop:360 length:333 start_codon:yes stop_codon:yes gene_type:complete
MDLEFSQYGGWIYVDPDSKTIEIIEENLELNMLCELLRCDSTDMEELGGGYLAYVDGEGGSQGRQTEWEFNENAFWGPVLIVKMGKEEYYLESCFEKDLNTIKPLVKFFY